MPIALVELVVQFSRLRLIRGVTEVVVSTGGESTTPRVHRATSHRNRREFADEGDATRLPSQAPSSPEFHSTPSWSAGRQFDEFKGFPTPSLAVPLARLFSRLGFPAVPPDAWNTGRATSATMPPAARIFSTTRKTTIERTHRRRRDGRLPSDPVRWRHRAAIAVGRVLGDGDEQKVRCRAGGAIVELDARTRIILL